MPKWVPQSCARLGPGKLLTSKIKYPAEGSYLDILYKCVAKWFWPVNPSERASQEESYSMELFSEIPIE